VKEVQIVRAAGLGRLRRRAQPYRYIPRKIASTKNDSPSRANGRPSTYRAPVSGRRHGFLRGMLLPTLFGLVARNRLASAGTGTVGSSTATSKCPSSSMPCTGTPIPKPLGTPNLSVAPPRVHHGSSPKSRQTRDVCPALRGGLKAVPSRVIPKILPLRVMPQRRPLRVVSQRTPLRVVGVGENSGQGMGRGENLHAATCLTVG
jgi:hypothetical protein